MTTLPIRFVNQLDGSPNANNDCVPASLASGAAALGVNVSAVQLLDAEYGASYTGPTAPWRYADDASDTLRTLGLTLDAVSGDEAALVARVHQEIAAGHPCMLAIPSQWGNFSIPVSVRRTQRWPDGTWLSTHFVCAYDEWAGGAGCMNPWGAFRHTNTDGGWASLLVLGTIWVLRKVASKMVPTGWHDDGTTLTAPGGITMNGYIRARILSEPGGWPADLLPVGPMYGIAGGWGMGFAATRLVNATTAGVVTEQPGPDYHAQVAALTAQLAAANAKIAALEAQLASGGGSSGGTPTLAEAWPVVSAALLAKLGA